MKTHLSPQIPRKGYALVLVLGILAISALMLGGILSWCSQLGTQVERNNRYNRTLAAAEAATEKVLSRISKDFQQGGEGGVYGNLAQYRTMVPSAAEDAYWGGYRFATPAGAANQVLVNRLNPEQQTLLNSQYAGLYGLAAQYQVASLAKDVSGVANVAAAVQQTLQVATIPVFQFAIFYSVDLEIHPGANMDITGRVHSNGKLYTQPNGSTLTYKSHVTCVDQLLPGSKKDGDLGTRSYVPPVFQGEKDEKVAALSLPVGTSNSPDDVYKILEIPPFGESASSALGQQRYYNRADVIIKVSDAGVVATSGIYNGCATVLASSTVSNFVNTTRSFYNGREQMTVRVTDIDVGAFRTWAEGSNPIRTALGRVPSTIYVDDLRTAVSGKEPGVRLYNGQVLPANGLTVATPDPIYVQGNYNAPAGVLGKNDTTGTKPASLVGDAITVLSSSWLDSQNGGSVAGYKTAGDTTVNAAFLAGIKQTTPREIYTKDGYSGGVENFPRFLENWSNKTLTYNGSMVVMFYSKIATGWWASATTYYSPPNRKWAFDVNFLDATKLPPGTPCVRSMIRGAWTTLGANPNLVAN
jgi:hypothetical protein